MPSPFEFFDKISRAKQLNSSLNICQPIFLQVIPNRLGCLYLMSTNSSGVKMFFDARLIYQVNEQGITKDIFFITLILMGSAKQYSSKVVLGYKNSQLFQLKKKKFNGIIRPSAFTISSCVTKQCQTRWRGTDLSATLKKRDIFCLRTMNKFLDSQFFEFLPRRLFQPLPRY